MTGSTSRVWRGTPGDRAMLAVSKRLLRTRIATLTERDQAGIARGEPAQALAVKTCKGTFVTAMPERSPKTTYATIATALSVRWTRPFSEVAQAIGALLAADDATLSDLATALISTRAICKREECTCGAQYAPMAAALVPGDAQTGEALDDLKAVKGDVAPAHVHSDRVRHDKATLQILAGMRASMNEEAA
jgi:hypothetical protein